jgi:hypothetical protein
MEIRETAGHVVNTHPPNTVTSENPNFFHHVPPLIGTSSPMRDSRSNRVFLLLVLLLMVLLLLITDP